MSDLVRGALIAIPKHQYESSEALGMSRAQTYWYIIIPQTVRRLIPLSINLITRMIKTTSLVLMIGVVDVMLDLAREGKTMVIVTHEMQFARAIASRVLFLDDGRIVEEAPPADFFDHPRTERAQRFLRTFTFDAVAKQ